MTAGLALPLVLGLLGAPPSTAHQPASEGRPAFEGVVVQKTTSSGLSSPTEARAPVETTSTVRIWIAKDGRVRTEIDGPSNAGGLERLVFPDEGRALVLDRRNKTARATPWPQAAPSGRWTAERIGKTSLHGLPVERVRVSKGRGQSVELWVTAALGPPPEAHPWAAALAEAGVKGRFPLRLEEKAAGVVLRRVETVRVKRRKVPADRLRMPPGYKKRPPIGQSLKDAKKQRSRAR